MSKVKSNASSSQTEDGAAVGSDFSYVKKIAIIGKPYRKALGIGLFAGLVATLLAIAGPLVMERLINVAISGSASSDVLRYGALLALVVALEQGGTFAQIYFTQIAGAQTVSALRHRVFEHLQWRTTRRFDVEPVGKMVTRVTNDTDAILEVFASGALNAFTDLLRLAGIILIMSIRDFRLALVCFAVGLPVVVLARWVRRRARDAFGAIRQRTATMNSKVNESLNGMAVIQAYNQEERSLREFDQINREYRDANIAAIKYDAMQDAAIEMITSVAVASILVASVYTNASFGIVVAFNAWVVRFFEPITALAQRYTLMQSGMSGAERIFGMLDEKDFDPGWDQRKSLRAELPETDEAIRFSDVKFSYTADKPVLRGLDLLVKRGQRIAIVGSTGAGKSTLASLLLRFYEYDEGSIVVDGLALRDWDPLELRRQFTLVQQDVVLFPGTILDNVAAGRDVDENRAEAVFRSMKLYESFILPKGGLKARVEEGGSNFSAGERQLIAMARALYRDAPILILDEATANIDSNTEALIGDALDVVLQGRTALIIAHRLSTVRSCDAIAVLEHGRMAEFGSHDELLESGGIYSQLYRSYFQSKSEV